MRQLPWRSASSRSIRCTLLALLGTAGLMVSSGSAGYAQTPAEAAPQSVSTSAPAADRSDSYSQLQQVLDMAPARQVGQPGNEAIDRWVEQQFEQAVAQVNTPGQQERMQQLLAESHEADQQLSAAIARRQVLASSENVLRSPYYIKYTLEDPAVCVFALLLIATTLLVAGRMQKRRELYWSAGALGVAALLLMLVAQVVTTATEQAATSGDQGTQTEASLDRAVSEAALTALKTDLAAAEELARLWQSGRITYPSTAFVPGQFELQLGDRKVPLHQLTPNLVDPGNLPADGFSGRVVYVGSALPDELARHSLTDAAVVMDFSSDRRWLDAIQLGAKVIIILEPQTPATLAQAAAKFSNSPLSIPRFYLQRKDAESLLGDTWREQLTGGVDASILEHRPGRWEHRELAADWLFIPGTTSPAEAGTHFEKDIGRQVVHIQAYKDAQSVVPALSPGASSAANLVLLQQLIEKFKSQPPTRPVLVTVVNDHTNALNGEQEVAHALFAAPAALILERITLERELARNRFIQKTYGQPPTAEFIEALQDHTESVGGQIFKVKTPILDRLTVTRNMNRQEDQILRLELNQLDSAGQGSSARAQKLQEQLDTLEADSAQLVRLMSLFNPLGKRLLFTELSPADVQALNDLFVRISSEAGVEADHLQRLREQQLNNIEVRRRLRMLTMSKPDEQTLASADWQQVMALRCPPVPALAMLTLDLSFGSDMLGFFHRGSLQAQGQNGPYDDNATQRVQALSRQSLLVASEFEKETGLPTILQDTVREVKGIPWQGHLGGKFAIASRVPHQFAVPALTLTSVRDGRQRTFTPHDTIDRLERDNFDKLMSYAADYLPRLINSADLALTLIPRGSPVAASYLISARVQDQFSVKVPQTKAIDALLMAMPAGSDLPTVFSMLGDVRPWPILLTDRRGAVMLRGSLYQGSSVHLFQYDRDYRALTRALDFGEGLTRFVATLPQIRSSPLEQRTIVCFDALKVDLIGLSDPLSLRPAGSIDVIDARQDSLPRHFSVAGVTAVTASKPVPLAADGTGCVMVEPNTPFKLKIGRGLAINTSPDSPTGRGFPANIGRLSNLVLTSAQDMWHLTDSRLQLLSDKGVVNETALALNSQANDRIISVVDQSEASARAESRIAAEQARGLAYRAYERGLGTINDLIKAVVIFLALVIPFCFFVMKLITPFTDVNRQLVLFGAVFVGMALLLHAVHPAFEVAKTPQVVVLAFVILGLAVFVSVVLLGRFNASMNQAVEESQMSDSMDASQGRLAGAAFLVGVNNMKRRRVRTTLTCATIVLVTFTMLSVISVGQDVEPVQVRVGGSTPYNGFLYMRPGMGPIHQAQLARMRAHFASDADTTARAWAQRLGKYGEYLPYTIQPDRLLPGAVQKSIEARVLLGVEKQEDGFTQTMPLVAGRWFSSNSAPEIILSVQAAGLLGITPGNFQNQSFWVQGRKLTLVGLLDDVELAGIQDLNNTPLLPLLTAAGQAKQAEAAAALEEVEDDVDGGGDAMSAPGVQVARASDVAFLPLNVVMDTGDATYRTLSVKFASHAAAADAWKAANSLIRYQHVRLAVGLSQPVSRGEDAGQVEAGQYTLASSSSTQVVGVMKVAIPIILAATIILNTMLGSVMERKREISIYNAIGLNPSHVMVFFLAESLVFGMVGSVAGYLIGQILSVLITKFQIVDLNLNYSSLSVVVVIFLTIGTVLLSTLYPAAMAARAAVPSGQRRWSLPKPDGDQIFVQFPFSYDVSRVLGVCAYLHDFMKQNSEASTGKFLAQMGPVGVVPAAAASEDATGPCYSMVFNVAPAPFDLGVNQTMEVYAYYDKRVRAHMLAVHLTRVSGETSNWVTVNQPFLEALRKRLLSWRSQREQTQQTYYQQGEQLFANAPQLPVKS